VVVGALRWRAAVCAVLLPLLRLLPWRLAAAAAAAAAAP
jgi:hypothetical protein